MHLNIQKNILFKALNHVQGVVEKRNTIPVLSNVLLTASQNKLSLTATDLDIEIVETIDADIISNGSVTVPAHTLYEIVRKLPDMSQVSLEYISENDRIQLKAGKSNFTLPCLPKDDFPLMVTSDVGVDFTIAHSDLKLILDKNKFAISQEEARYYLGGIYFHHIPQDNSSSDVGQISGVATDGHRLSKVSLIAPQGCQTMPNVIIPRKTVNELIKLLDDIASDIEVNVTDTKIRFFANNIQLTSKLIDGTFPDYKRVIPLNNDKLVKINTKDFINAIDRVSTVSLDKIRIVKLVLQPSKIILSVQSNDLGSAIEEIEVAYQGPDIEVGFNARYILDILAQIDTTETLIKFGDPNTPIVICDTEDDMLLFILMPMRI